MAHPQLLQQTRQEYRNQAAHLSAEFFCTSRGVGLVEGLCLIQLELDQGVSHEQLHDDKIKHQGGAKDQPEDTDSFCWI